MKYKCLVFDHDDTTVDSTRNIHYPCFMEYMKINRPHINITLEEYIKLNFEPGVTALFRDICGLSEKEMVEEQQFWINYAAKHVSSAFAGIKEIMEEQKSQGGIIAVVSHSYSSNILRDYEFNHLPMPDITFGWEQPKEERKPSPVPINRLMEKYSLKKEDILVIDDLKPGLDMAKAAGVKIAAAGWAFDIPENEKYMRDNADYYLKTVSELASLVL